MSRTGSVVVTIRADMRRFDAQMRHLRWRLWWFALRLAWRDVRRSVRRLIRQLVAGVRLLVDR